MNCPGHRTESAAPSAPRNEVCGELSSFVCASCLPPRPVPELRQELEDLAATWPLAEGTAFETVDAGGCPCEWITATFIDGEVLHIPDGQNFALVTSLFIYCRIISRVAAFLRCVLIRLRLFPRSWWWLLSRVFSCGRTALLLYLRLYWSQVPIRQLSHRSGASVSSCELPRSF